ncbi:MAG: AtpZ/AtpI family protein [Patescibacteria group bacterium]
MPESPGTLRQLLLALRLAWSLGYIIAIPAVLFGFSGAYIDKHVGTSPLFLLLGFAIAVSLSSVGIRRKLREITSAQE